MIVCRRPVKLYDCDLVGLVVLLALFAGVGVAAHPLIGSARSTARWDDSLRDARGSLAQSGEALRTLRAQVSELERLEAQERATLASPGQIAETLSTIARQAAELQLVLLDLAPDAPTPHGELVSIDIRIGARGEAVSLVRLLDGLQRSYPWTRVERIEIASGEDEPGVCLMGATIRWFALPSASGEGTK